MSTVRQADPGENVAVERLLIRARAARESGELQQASRFAERAHALDGRYPATYLEMARIRFAEGQREWAEQLARKGLAVNPGKRERRELEALIVRCRH